MSAVDLSAAAITGRLRQVSQAADLTAARRLDAKIDMTPTAVSHRLREAFELYELCRSLAVCERPATP